MFTDNSLSAKRIGGGVQGLAAAFGKANFHRKAFPVPSASRLSLHLFKRKSRRLRTLLSQRASLFVVQYQGDIHI